MKLNTDLGIDVSRHTIARSLKINGLNSFEKQTKPMLSKKNVADRLSFANTHKDWTVEDWKKIIWSDETKINRFCLDGRSWYWAHEGTSLQPNQVKQTVKHGGGSIMLWGCMTSQGPGLMHRIEGKMNQHLYKQILNDKLLKTIEYYNINPVETIFQHDNSPIHKAKSVLEYLNIQQFQLLEWPAQSPDLNPIEHLWSKLKKELNKYEHPPNGMIELWKRIEHVWNEKITANDCLLLIKSMPRRIEAVRKAKGWWTKC